MVVILGSLCFSSLGISTLSSLPSFFSGDNFAELEIKPVQAIITATGLAAFAVVASVLLGTTIDLPAAAPPAPPAAASVAPPTRTPVDMGALKAKLKGQLRALVDDDAFLSLLAQEYLRQQQRAMAQAQQARQQRKAAESS